MYDSDPNLTRRQRAFLWTLVRKDAFERGYRSIYTEDYPQLWPRKMKELRTIARKLRA